MGVGGVCGLTEFDEYDHVRVRSGRDLFKNAIGEKSGDFSTGIYFILFYFFNQWLALADLILFDFILFKASPPTVSVTV